MYGPLIWEKKKQHWALFSIGKKPPYRNICYIYLLQCARRGGNLPWGSLKKVPPPGEIMYRFEDPLMFQSPLN